MKFMTITTRKDIFYTLPPAEQSKLGLALIEFLLEQKKRIGEKWNFYSIPGWNRQVSIGEYSSLEEYSQTLQTPMAQRGYTNFESYPLIEIDEKTIKAMIERFKAAK